MEQNRTNSYRTLQRSKSDDAFIEDFLKEPLLFDEYEKEHVEDILPADLELPLHGSSMRGQSQDIDNSLVDGMSLSRKLSSQLKGMVPKSKSYMELDYQNNPGPVPPPRRDNYMVNAQALGSQSAARPYPMSVPMSMPPGAMNMPGRTSSMPPGAMSMPPAAMSMPVQMHSKNQFQYYPEREAASVGKPNFNLQSGMKQRIPLNHALDFNNMQGKQKEDAKKEDITTMLKSLREAPQAQRKRKPDGVGFDLQMNNWAGYQGNGGSGQMEPFQQTMGSKTSKPMRTGDIDMNSVGIEVFQALERSRTQSVEHAAMRRAGRQNIKRNIATAANQNSTQVQESLPFVAQSHTAVESLVQRANHLEQDNKNLTVRLAFMNRLNSAQSLKIEELEKFKQQLEKERQFLMSQQNRAAAYGIPQRT